MVVVGTKPRMRNQGSPIAARVRAARAYAGIDQAELAQALGLGLGTYKRIEQGNRPASKPERIRIAQFCGVPIGFLESGWDHLLIATDDLLARRVLEELRALRADVAAQVPVSRRLQRVVMAARAALEDESDAGNEKSAPGQ